MSSCTLDGKMTIRLERIHDCHMKRMRPDLKRKKLECRRSLGEQVFRVAARLVEVLPVADAPLIEDVMPAAQEGRCEARSGSACTRALFSAAQRRTHQQHA
eukprot:6186411-Pleurochrysis_carterae.AAC.2